ncbi:hypothetical protein JMG10_50475, partial [Nostoc ellipsosporum NOK]|nr:hypothetical protein [Nostoc ellipsosporum NOK]
RWCLRLIWLGASAAQHFPDQKGTERDHQRFGDVAAGNGVVKKSHNGSSISTKPSPTSTMAHSGGISSWLELLTII